MPLNPITLKQRCVRDLAWAIGSPPLISGNIAGVNWWPEPHFKKEFSDCLPILWELDRHPKPLLEALNNAQSHRLGHYFEALIAYWLKISPNYELLLANHPIRTPEKTLGEIDFLIREKTTDKIIHLEVAVKFYLGIADLDNMANWYGSGLRDRLDLKFNHLRDHQTQLTAKHPNLMPYPVNERACMLKGRLFYPPDTTKPTVFTAQNHQAGHWYQLPDYPPQPQNYLHLTKRDWLSEILTTDGREPVSLPESIEEPILIAAHDDQAEQKRFFLLPENFWISQTPFPTAAPNQ